MREQFIIFEIWWIEETIYIVFYLFIIFFSEHTRYKRDLQFSKTSIIDYKIKHE